MALISDIQKILQQVYGEGRVRRRWVYIWVKQLQDGREDATNNRRPCHPKISITNPKKKKKKKKKKTNKPIEMLRN
jgi:hypothetical protein